MWGNKWLDFDGKSTAIFYLHILHISVLEDFGGGWWKQTLSIDGSKVHRIVPFRSYFFHFRAVSGKIGHNNMITPHRVATPGVATPGSIIGFKKTLATK